MPTNLVRTPEEEAAWSHAKRIVRAEYRIPPGPRFWRLVNGTYERIRGKPKRTWPRVKRRKKAPHASRGWHRIRAKGTKRAKVR